MNNLDLNKKLLNLMESAMMEKKADKDYDGDGKIESPEDEYKGSKDKAIKKAMGKNVNEAEEKDSKMPSKSHVMKMCKAGKSKKEICDMHPECDQKELKDMIDDCMEEHKEKTNESVNTLADSLREKLQSVMETSEEVTEASEEELEEEQEVDAEPVAEQEEIAEDESLDEMAELLKMAGLGEGTADCSSMPRHSAPTKGPEQENGYEGDFVGEEQEVQDDVFEEDEPAKRSPRPQSEIDDDAVDDEVERKSSAFAEKHALRGKDLEKYVGKTITLWQEGSTNPPIDRKFKIEPGKNGQGISIEGEHYGPEDFVDHNAAADYSWPSEEVANKYHDMREKIYQKAFYYESTLEMEQLRKMAGIS
jgi:hypothetical protein